jgi:hypothetical protein
MREEAPDGDPLADPLSEPPAPRKRRRRWPWILFGVVVVLPILAVWAWTEIALHVSYSADGHRAGYIQKLSRKGWICKTWEGELAMVPMPGAVQQERFPFTVRSDSLAQAMTKVMGSRVSITYEQHKGLPTSCFGDTEYFVTAIQPATP